MTRAMRPTTKAHDADDLGDLRRQVAVLEGLLRELRDATRRYIGEQSGPEWATPDDPPTLTERIDAALSASPPAPPDDNRPLSRSEMRRVEAMGMKPAKADANAEIVQRLEDVHSALSNLQYKDACGISDFHLHKALRDIARDAAALRAGAGGKP